MVQINSFAPAAEHDNRQSSRQRKANGRQRSLLKTTMASMAVTLLAGCASVDIFDDSQGISSANGITVVDRFTQQAPDTESINSDYTTSVPQLGALHGANGVGVRGDHPDVYTVVRGDTLWDISGRFLTDPWQWPKVWKANPGIENPHLIYPGDHIGLRYDANGIPSLVVSRNGDEVGDSVIYRNGSGGTEKLSPRIREQSLKEAIPMIPGDAIRQFLVYPRVVSAKQLSQAPYVIGNYEDRLTSALGHEIYARGNISASQPSYGIFRHSKELRDPVTNELLGHEVSHVASARLLQEGDPATLLITSNKTETISGDRLMSAGNGFAQHTYIPRTPAIQGGEGRVVSLVDAITQAGRNQVIVLNLGERAGIQVGDVMAVERRGGVIKDRYSGKRNSTVALPSTRTGVVMVFQTFDKVSYALVMESTRPINIDDIITEI